MSIKEVLLQWFTNVLKLAADSYNSMHDNTFGVAIKSVTMSNQQLAKELDKSLIKSLEEVE